MGHGNTVPIAWRLHVDVVVNDDDDDDADGWFQGLALLLVVLGVVGVKLGRTKEEHVTD